MKCPNCGAEMREGSLYCEQCGEDIHIVPDFEPELERNMEQSLADLKADVGESREQKTEAVVQTAKGKKEKQHWSRLHIIGWCCIVVFALSLMGAGTAFFRYYSVDHQVENAKKAVAKAQYEKAVEYYNRAIELDKSNVSLKFDLAEVYFLKNDKTEYENLLTQIVNDPRTNSEQLESAYGKLIAIYRASEDYQTINDILLACGSDSVKTIYQGYLAEPPQFSIPDGSYDEVEALKLTVVGQGNIYYTLDGSDPDEDSDRYMAPILLENGEYLIKAVFVNENGVFSEIARAEYQIDVEELEAPEFNVDNGDYITPVFITVTNNPEDIYYTTDGTNPTLDSTRYTEPIPMPLGVSNYRFARLEAGRTSKIVERTFDLILETEFTSEEAVEKILQYAVDSGKIEDRQGHFDDTEATYQYQFQYVVHIRDVNDFYVVAEMLTDAQGLSVKTGNYYAVNVYTGYFYKLQIESGIYTLMEL